MLDQVLKIFRIVPDFDLDIMSQKQTLSSLTSKIIIEISKILDLENPDLVLVHGDTTTTFATSLSCFYKKIKIAHVEAGLRTNDKFSPWPEEINRKFTDAISDIYFAPTKDSKQNLIDEKISEESIFITGNTVIDSLLFAKDYIHENKELFSEFSSKFPFSNNKSHLILVTGHRRENFGKGFESICMSLKMIAEKLEGVDIVYPVHLNPNVQIPVHNMLGDINNIHLIEPQEYLPFVYLMNKSYLILTDSGGIQEEAPSLGKPVLLMRDNTERPEGVKAGTVKVIGTDEFDIFNEVKNLVMNKNEYNKMSSKANPFGDGKASRRISSIIKDYV